MGQEIVYMTSGLRHIELANTSLQLFSNCFIENTINLVLLVIVNRVLQASIYYCK